MSKKQIDDDIDFQVLPHEDASALNDLLHNQFVMADFSNPSHHNKFNILNPEDNNGLHIMHAHNRFIEYLKSRMDKPKGLS